MKIVYITGCLGFIGSWIAIDCLNKGWLVYGVDKITYAANRDVLRTLKNYDNFKFIEKDINDLDFLYECDYIINTAAETHVCNSIINSKEFIHSNVNGVYNLLELIRMKYKYKMPTLIHFSTDEVYGDIEEGFHTEESPLKPSNPYSSTKASADMLIQAWGRTYGVPYIIVRPTNNYGIGQYIEKLIPKTLLCIRLGRKIPVHENGEPKRNWLYAYDTVRAIHKIIESGVTNEIYNIGGNYETKNIDVIKKVISYYFVIEDYDIEKYVDFGYSRPGQDVRYGIDDSKLRLLGWEPEADFDVELRDIVDEYKKNLIW